MKTRNQHYAVHWITNEELIRQRIMFLKKIYSQIKYAGRLNDNTKNFGELRGTNLVFRLVQLTKPFESLIRDVYPSLIGFNRAEREILRWYRHLGKRVK